MAEHPHGHDHQHAQVRTIERHCDVAVLDGAAAGLGAALEVARAGRSVVVIDAEQSEDAELIALREDIRRHGGEVLAGRVVGTGDGGGRVRVALTGGHAVVARRVLEGPDLARAGGMAEDLDREDRAEPQATANQADWDERYGGEQIWSGNPNGALVAEVTGLPVGRALDVGAGEGGDAVWLAEQGWRVTANDVTSRALARVAAEAERRGLEVELLHADANVADALPAAAYDLVTAMYASIPRTADDRGVRNLLGAVAPGGVLLIVSHDLAPMRSPVDTAVTSRPFDPDAYVRVDDLAAALAGQPGWEVEVHELRPRPAGAASGHHVDDVVLRARRS